MAHHQLLSTLAFSTCSPCASTIQQERVSGCRSQSVPKLGGYERFARRHLFFPTLSSYLTLVCLITCPQSFDATALLSNYEYRTRFRTKAGRPKRRTMAPVEAPCMSPPKSSRRHPCASHCLAFATASHSQQPGLRVKNLRPWVQGSGFGDAGNGVLSPPDSVP